MGRILRLLTTPRLLCRYYRTVGKMATLQDDAHTIFRSAVSAVLPPRMLQRVLAVKEGAGSATLECGGREFRLDGNLYLVGSGKAVLGMAAAAERIVGRYLVRGVISIPLGMEESLRRAGKSLILSDVIGDDLEVIASGPTVPSTHSAEDCLRILERYDLRGAVPEAVEDAITSRPGEEGAEDFPHVHNILIGSNLIALREAERESQTLGYLPLLLSAAISGDVAPVSRFFALLARVICSILTSSPEQAQLEREILHLAATMAVPGLHLAKRLQEVKENAGNADAVCALFGGEITVQVRGKGKGGRNQELALRVAAEWHRSSAAMAGCEVLFLSGGTDGQDGPTDAAGASSYPGLVAQGVESGLDVERSLNASDSNGFFRQFQNGRHLLVTGLTGTNVMDVQVLLVRRHAERP
ncbi:hypothetical protein AB205_0018860, partial [Aquarana catesbeiana]